MNYFERLKKYYTDNPKEYWFKTKLYGWGWTPVRWQGWLTLAVFIALIVYNGMRLEEKINLDPFEFLLETGFLVAILLFICWKKGERPRWQWGPPDPDKEKK